MRIENYKLPLEENTILELPYVRTLCKLQD